MSFLLHPSVFHSAYWRGFFFFLNTFGCFSIPQKPIEHFRKLHAKYLLRSLSVVVLRSVLNTTSVS